MRRKIISTLILLITLLVLSPHSALANGLTLVTGHITGPDGNPLGGATVHIDCNGHLKDQITDVFGNYSIHFNTSDCDAYDFVTGSVTNGGNTKSETVQVSKVNTANIDLSFFTNIESVPEFGLTTGVAALLGGAGAYFLFKKKQQTISS